MAEKLSGLCRCALQGGRGEMVRGRVIEGLLLLILPAVSECAPTPVDWDSSAVMGPAGRSRVESLGFRRGTGDIAGRKHLSLTAAAAEFHKPSVKYLSCDKLEVSELQRF